MSPQTGPDAQPDEQRLRVLFALLFSSPEPVTLDRIREVLHGQPGGEEQETLSPRDCLRALEAWMEARELPLALHAVGKAWRLLTSEDVSAELESVRKRVVRNRIGPAALEVLSLVAYRQPVLKADIDAIRGVQSGPHLRHLLDLHLIRMLGRADLPGRPFLYGTTRAFLDRFGLKDLGDLPQSERLAIPAEAPPGKETVAAAGGAGEADPPPEAPAGQGR